ncbi:MAG: helix-turn-helix transcriptional regulator [Pseudomonadota bacterium]
MSTLKVLGPFYERPKQEFTGRQIGRETGLPSGTVYPILIRLAEAGWLSNRWEENSPQQVGRPRRRYYRITKAGFQKTHGALMDLGRKYGAKSWA